MNDKLLDIAINTAIVAGQRIVTIYKENDFGTEFKEDATPITRADKAAHEFIVAALDQTGIPVISEEGPTICYKERKDWQRFWLVDPLDGTKEFVKKNGEFTVNIALIENNEAILGVIYVPISEELYYGKLGEQAVKAQYREGKVLSKQNLPLKQEIRKRCIVVASRSFKDAATEHYIADLTAEVVKVSRGSSLKLCMVAEGSADVYPRFVHLKEWDIAAGVAIINAAGGSVQEAEAKREVTFNSERLQAPYFIAKKKNTMKLENIQKLMQLFVANEKVLEFCPFGNGHINDTYQVILENKSVYLLQRVNHHVFRDVQGMMNNIQKVTHHIAAKGKPTLHFLQTTNGKDFYKTKEGAYWRVMQFEANTKSFETTGSHEIAAATGRAIADFQIDISELDPKDFIDVIPLFHNLEDRLRQLDEAVAANEAGRLESVQDLVNYSRILRRDLLAFYREKEIPLRITHNDTKLNNILFTEDDKPLCLVDLDTVMPGFVHYDFGDVVRTMCNTAEDDEKNLEKVQFNYPLYQSYKEGYLSIARSFLTPKEEEWLDVSGKLMTYIMAIRFLADYLNGDVYYKINYPMHNYDRARCQFKLLKEMYKAL